MSERQLRRAWTRQAERQERRERRVGTRTKVAAGAGAALGATVVFAPGAQAATFQVTETNDEDDGTDACETTPSDCSLREALYDANDTTAPDVVTFASNVTGTIELTEGQLEIGNGPVEIQGPGADVLAISGSDDSRIFKLYGFDAPNTDVSISGLTLRDGAAALGPDGGEFYSTGGGAILNIESFPVSEPYVADLTIADSVLTDNNTFYYSSPYDEPDGGAIKSLYGDVTITGTQVSGNYAYSEGGGVYVYGADLTIAGSTLDDNESEDDEGGGVYVDESNLSITGSVVSNNTAFNEGGGVYVDNTADDGGTDVVIADSVFTGNEAYEGGGVYLEDNDGAAVIERSTFSGNTSPSEGGGIHIDEGVDAPVTIDRTTVSGNTAGEEGGDGGGIYLYAPDYAVTIQNSTVSNNYAYYDGGGIAMEGDLDEDEDITIRNSTIASNSVGNAEESEGGGLYRGFYEDGGNFYGDDVELSSTIVADNSAPQFPDIGEEEEDGTGSFLTGFSLLETTGNATLSETPAGSNLLGIDPQLGPLANNGGPNQTHAPGLASPALDHGVANGLSTDQRGLARTSDLALVSNGAGSDGTDIGSVEIQASEVEAQCQATTVRRIAGSASDDTLTGTDAPEALFGLAGNDNASGAGGNDCVNGDEGRDNTKGGPGKDIVKGGAGKDKASGGGGKDKVKGQAGKDNLKGGGGADKLSGAGGKDRLSGGGGKDRLKGGPGKDKLTGGGGKDRFNCGGGKDKVTAQAKDKVSASCEKVVEKG